MNRHPGAPVVIYPVHPEGWVPFLAGTLALVATLIAWAWWRWGGAGTAELTAYALVQGLCLALVGRLGWRPPAGELIWNGTAWTFAASGAVAWPVRVVPLIDGQAWILVKLCPESASPLWVLLRARRAPARWPDLRRAVCAAQWQGT